VPIKVGVIRVLQHIGQATEVAPIEPSAGRPPTWTIGATPCSGDFNRACKFVHHIRSRPPDSDEITSSQ
jgi:hypothetical protein